MNAALYARVSTDEQAEKFGLGSQVTELRAFAARKGYTVAEEYLDDGYTGADLDRPALSRLRDAARAHQVQAILVYDPDRLSRRLGQLLLLIEEFEKAGVQLVFQTMPKDASPEGDLLVHVRGAISEYERQKIRERTLRGKREKARRGLIVAGPAAYGYRRDPAQPGKLVVHAEEAAVVRQAYTWLADQQWSTRAIALELTRWGILPPKSRAWALSSVARMLRDPIYVGRAYYNRRQWSGTSYKARPAGEWFEIPVPPIVNPLVYQKVQAQLARNRHRYQGRRASGSTCSRAW